MTSFSFAAENSPSISPVNQVFQFMYSATCSTWRDGSTNNSSAYLWIPEHCQKVRGLLILCTNVPEHRLVGHPLIRQMCTQNDLGIVWCVPTFMNFRKDMPKEYATATTFLQQLLDGLARVSGYEEVATVPWLPMGESGHLLMVDALVENKPDRCIAGIWIKNNHLPPVNRTVPALVIYGTAQEWSQDKTDIRSKWNDVGAAYEGIVNQRKKNPDWPMSYVIDGQSGHFDCSERLTQYIANYIGQAVRARLPDAPAEPLKTIKIEQGYLADLPVPGHEGRPVRRAGETEAANRALPWYFDKTTADDAKEIASINWKAQTQFPGFLDAQGNILPFDFNGITNLKSVQWEADGRTFTVRAKMLDKIPSTFIGAGEPLVSTAATPVIDWLCGPIEPLGAGRFRIALDRTYGFAASYLCARQEGSDAIRGVVQPTGVNINSLKNTQGTKQTITFEKINDVQVGVESIPLTAKSDSGLPVDFFVVAGPAIVKDSRLHFTPIPPRSKFPIAVTVAAWQWGRAGEPAVKMADIVRQEFKINQAGAQANEPRRVYLSDLLKDQPQPVVMNYKTTTTGALQLHRFDPPGLMEGERRPAVVWIHGGAWVAGNAQMFFPHARYFASRGAVAFSVDYRLASEKGTGLSECVMDCRSAIRFIRQHADELHIDPKRIAVMGDSAGGHLAAALMIQGLDDPSDNLKVSARPDAMVLYNPITDLSDPAWVKYAIGGVALQKKPPTSATQPTSAQLDLARRLSPVSAISSTWPPTLVAHGSADKVVDLDQSRRFTAAVNQTGGSCVLEVVQGARHAFVCTGYTAPEAVVVEAIRAADIFLIANHLLDGSPTLSSR